MARRSRGLVGFLCALTLGMAVSHARVDEPMAVFVVGAGGKAPSDLAVKDRLARLGYEVVVRSTETLGADDIGSAAVVLVSTSAPAAGLGPKLRLATVPVMTWQPALFPHLGMTGVKRGLDYGFASSGSGDLLLDSAHPVSAGLSTQSPAVRPGTPVGWGLPAGEAIVVARLAGDMTRAAVFGFEQASPMRGLSAPARRLGFLGAGPTLSADGWRLLEASLAWVVRRNQSPVVDAGEDLEATIGEAVQLTAHVTDDGAPENRPLAVRWSVVSGPRDAAFGDPGAATTVARFHEAGTYDLRIEAHDGLLGSSDQLVVVVRPSPMAPSRAGRSAPTLQSVPAGSTALLVTGLVTSAGDTALKLRLETLGYTVALKHDFEAQSSDADGKDLVVIAGTALASGAPFRDVSAGVVTLQPVNAPYEMRLVGSPTDSGNDSATRVQITRPGDPHAAGLSGTPTVVTQSSSLGWGIPCADGVVVATVEGDPTHATSFWYPPGSRMCGGLTAPGRRVGLFVTDAAATKLTADGGSLFDAAVTWTGGFSNAPPGVDAGTAPPSLLCPSTITLNGNVVDDGPDPLSRQWTQLSGPGSTTFGSPTSAVTTACFSAQGQYVLRLAGTDGAGLSSYDDVTVNAYVANSAPLVDAGPDQPDVNFVTGTTLAGQVTDEGLMQPWTAQWSKVSGPGVVTFGSPTALTTGVTFSSDGTYVVRLTANDGELSASDDVTVTVTSTVLLVVGNAATLTAEDQAVAARLQAQGFVVEAKSDEAVVTNDANGKTLIVIATSTSAGVVTNTFKFSQTPLVSLLRTGWGYLGLIQSGTDAQAGPLTNLNILDPDHPIAGTLSGNVPVTTTTANVFYGTTGTGVSGVARVPGTGKKVVFAYEKNAQMVGLKAPARRVAIGFSNAIITNLTPAAQTLLDRSFLWAAGTNELNVDAGSDQVIPLGASASLAGLVRDDGMPNDTPTVGWTQVSGPATATFMNVNATPTGTPGELAVTATAEFPVAGTYVLRLTASDGELTTYEDVVILVNAAPVVNAGADQTIAVGDLALLDGQVDDDTLPGALTVGWSKVAGPGAVRFTAPNGADTAVEISVPGKYVFRLSASDGMESASDDVTVTATVSTSGSTDVLLVGASQPSAGDDALRGRLEVLGYSVTSIEGAVVTAADANGKAVVVVGGGADADAIGNRLRDVPVPVVVANPFLYDEMAMAAADRLGVDGAQTQLVIQDATHPLAAGLSGTVAVTSSPTGLGWGIPEAGAAWVVNSTVPGHASVFAYEQGVAMSSAAAPARRVGLFVYGDAPALLTLDGWALVEAAIHWAATPAPRFSPPPGIYDAVSVTLSTTIPDAEIRYTLDGSEPATGSLLYTAPISLTSSTTIKAIAVPPIGAPSPTAIGTYLLQAATPTFDPPAGTYVGPQDVQVTCMTAGAEIRYTTDGSDPTIDDEPIASGSYVLVDRSMTLKARAWSGGLQPSAIAEAQYEVGVPAPVLDPPGGDFPRPFSVTVSCSAPGLTVHYRTDGLEPTEADPPVACGGTIPVTGDLTLSARAFIRGMGSDTVIGRYSVTPRAAAGPAHRLVLLTDGTLWAWGENGSGQLGNGGFEPSADPVRASMDGAVDVSAGGSHSLALHQDGTVWAWGDNSRGQLGDGGYTGRPDPAPVPGLTRVTAIAAGSAHSIALDADGRVWAWGDNSYGQLGSGAGDSSAVPVPVPNLTGVVQVASGLRHNLARRTDGTVWAWGDNALGQLGDGNWGPGTGPVQAVGLAGVVSIGAGDDHSLAVDGGGSVWGWGDGRTGQLGGSVTEAINEAVRVESGSCQPDSGARPAGRAASFAAAELVDGGAGHSAGVFGPSSAEIRSWGRPGGACPTPEDDFVRSLLFGEFVRISAAGDHNIAVERSGRVWYWDEGAPGRELPFEVIGPDTNGQFKVFPPRFDLAPGVYREEQQVTITEGTPGSEIHYTLDGTEPSTSSPVIASGTAVPITRITEIFAIAYKPGRPASDVVRARYVLKVEDPVLTPPPSGYDAPLDVTMTVETSEATLRYALNTWPSSQDPEVPSGTTVTVSPTAALNVIASRDGWESSMLSGFYRLGVVTPVLTPPGGSFADPVAVTVTTSTAGATLRYTTDGSEPETSDLVIASGGTIRVEGSVTLSVRGWHPDIGESDVVRGTYRFTLPAPTLIAERTGGQDSPLYLRGASSVNGATVRCTLDGSEPTVFSRVCTLPVPIDSTTTVKARAFMAGWDPSAPTTQAFAVAPVSVVAPTLDLEPGPYPSRRSVRVSTTTAGAEVRYTTNGLDPTASDPLVPADGKVVVDRSMFLKVRAFLGAEASLVARADYLLTGAVTAGDTVVALEANGRVSAWGDNREGQLGAGTWDDNATSPVAAALLDTIVAVASGTSHTVALKEDGEIRTWGSNADGQLGIGDVATLRSPTPILVGLPPGSAPIVAIAAGSDFSAALGADGALWGWGDAPVSGSPEERAAAYAPVAVAAPPCARIAATGKLLICVDGAGEAWSSLGPRGPFAKHSGALGLAAAAPGDVVLVTDGGRHGAVARVLSGGAGGPIERLLSLPLASRLAENALVARGASPWAQDPQWTSWFNPGVEWVVAEAWPSLAVGAASAVKGDGSVWRWGSNTYGQLGDGSTVDRAEPGEVPGFRLFVDPWPLADSDGDGLTNLEELDLGTDPLRLDTNGDGVADGVAAGTGRDPVSADLDGDGLSNSQEIGMGTNPLVADTDGDGVPDGLDAYPLDPDRSQPAPPDPGDSTPPDVALTDPANADLVSETISSNP